MIYFNYFLYDRPLTVHRLKLTHLYPDSNPRLKKVPLTSISIEYTSSLFYSILSIPLLIIASYLLNTIIKNVPCTVWLTFEKGSQKSINALHYVFHMHQYVRLSTTALPATFLYQETLKLPCSVKVRLHVTICRVRFVFWRMQSNEYA